ncbi:MAG: RraA family protein [Lachnospiraceae bacterium]|nr:RraA family protein [Lachnospiraceae bacterium]
MNEYTKLCEEIIDGFLQFDTASVSDAMDRLGLKGGLPGIHPVIPASKMCGQAFTVHYVPCGMHKDNVGDFIDDVAPGQVIVIDNGGRLDCTVWGDIMSLYASKHNIAGTLIDGVCRDVPAIRELQYPVFTKSTYMVTGKDRVYVDHINVPVNVSNVQILPGDLILADDSGAVVIPCSQAEKVLAAAREIEEKEEAIRQKVLAGSKLKDARKELGYHTLQTKQ